MSAVATVALGFSSLKHPKQERGYDRSLTANAQHPTPGTLRDPPGRSLHSCKAERLWRRLRHCQCSPMLRGPRAATTTALPETTVAGRHASPPRTLPASSHGRIAPLAWKRVASLHVARCRTLPARGPCCACLWALGSSGSRSPLHPLNWGVATTTRTQGSAGLLCTEAMTECSGWRGHRCTPALRFRARGARTR